MTSSSVRKRRSRDAAWHTLAPEIVENILSFLPARSLVNALQVCHTWKGMAERTLKQRQRFVCRLFGQIQWGIHNRTQRNNLQTKDCQEAISEFLTNMAIVPLAVIICVSDYHLGNYGQKEFRLLFVAIKKHLPRKCLIFGCYVSDVMGETSNGDLEQCTCDQSKGGVSVLVVPKVQGVHMDVFKFTRNEVHQNRASHTMWKESFGNLASKDIKFVFLLGNSPNMPQIVQGVKEVFGSHVVVIGGISKPFAVLASGNYHSNHVMGLAVGGTNVVANSVIDPLPSYLTHTLPSTIEKLYQNQPTKQSICFLVKCAARNAVTQLDTPSDLVIFRKIFPPSFPLLGITVYGEVGSNMPLTQHQPGQSSASNQQQRVPLDDEEDEDDEDDYGYNNEHFFHSYAAVFSVLTFLDKQQH